MTTVQILSVSDATASLKHAIESNTAFTEIWLEGELSRVTKHKSGHIYFTIKDTDASVRCACFRNTPGSISPTTTATSKTLPNSGAHYMFILVKAA